jgi:hypothetical protein
MADTIICAAEPESPGFHPSGKAGFSVRLSFETDITIIDTDDEPTRKAKENTAKQRFGSFLGKLASVKFALYRKNSAGDTLTLSTFVQTSPPVSVDADLSNYFFEWLSKSAESRNLPFFAAPSATQQVSADDVGAVHVLHGAATWTAPVPHRLGLAHIVRFESADVEPGGVPLTDLVLVPFFDAAMPANTYPIVAGANPFEFEYTSGLDGASSKYRGSVIAGRLTPDPTSLVDTETGFVEGDTHSREFYAVLKRLEQKAGSLLAAFPAVLGVSWASVKTKGGLPADADLVTFCRLVWRAITSLATSLDSIHIALTMPDARGNLGREGPLLAPLVDRLLHGLELSTDGDVHKFHEQPDEVLKALKTSIRQQIVFVQPSVATRESYATTLAIVSGLRSVEGQVDAKATPLLEAALTAFKKDPVADDLSADIGKLKAAVFSDAKLSEDQLKALKQVPFDQLEIRHAIQLNDRLNAELAAIADAVQSEEGVESTILRVLGSGGFGTTAGVSIDNGFADALLPAKKAEVAAICGAAREEYRRLLADSFNGAEAVRQACSSVYADFLMKSRPDETATLKLRLENSKLFLSRVDGPPAAPPPPPDPDNPFAELVDLLVDPARPWFDKGTGGAGPETDPLRDGFDDAVEDLFPTEGTRRFIPAHAPPPLPLQITVDQNTAELDEFENLFAGIALLVRRSDKKEDTTGKKDWAYANLAELKVLDIAGSSLPKPEVKGFFIHPAHTAETDGRRQLYIEYAGLPSTTSAFDATMPNGMQAGTEQRPFFAIDYPTIPDELEFQKLATLAYGTELDVVGHVVSKGGVLPNALQDSIDAPWKPKPIVDPALFPAKPAPAPGTPARSIIQTFAYSRLTAIGRTVITEDIGRPRRIGAAIGGVQPLAVDYPRSGLSSAHDVFLDVMRNGDGTGTITAPAIGAVSKLQLKDVWCWDGKGTLECAVLNLAGATPADEEGLKISVPVTPGELGSLELALTRKPDQAGKHIYVATATLGASAPLEQELALEHVPASFWLRLRLLPQTPSGALWISFADATPEIRDANTGSRPMPDNLVLIADTASLPKVWKPDVPAVIAGRIELPRMGYLDFDRWLNNETLRTEARGPVTKAYFDTFKTKLLTAYLMRNVSEPIAARLDRLPDLAVAGLLLELVPLDGLFAPPGSLTTDPPFEKNAAVARMAHVVRLPSLGERLKKIAPDIDKIGPTALLKALDEALVRTISCEAAGTKLGIEEKDDHIVVRIPEGMTVRLSARPLVSSEYFNTASGFASAIDARVQQLACGRFTDKNAILGATGKTYLVFEGAALSIERMIGPVSFEKRDESRPWQMTVEDKTKERVNQWAALVDITLEKAHQPAGSARSYNVMFDPALPPAKSDRGWNWRQLASVDISTQRWRFTGRPIYTWIEPPAPAIGVASTEVKATDALSGALAQFEKEAFFDRDDLDAEVKTVTLDPTPAVTKVLNVEWEKASATFFRHRFSVRSRYAGAMAKVSDGVAPAWIRVDDGKPQSWFRVAMLADRARVQLTRPQLRALIPLTSTPGDGPSTTPPVLAVLQERPFDYGGLADRIGAEVRTGIGYEMKNPKTDPKVEPADARKEGGPDPRLTYRSLDRQSASGLVLQAEGPVGLTFDSSSAPAPAFPNSMFVLQPKLLFGEAKRLEEHFVSVGLRRYLDPRWLTAHAPEGPKFDTAWWHKFVGAAALGFGKPDKPKEDDKCVCWIEATEDEKDQKDEKDKKDEKIFSVYFNPKAIDKTARDASTATQALVLSRSKGPTKSGFAFLHVPLEDGRASLSVFALPASGDVPSGAGNLPILLASVDWSIPDDSDDWQGLTLKLNPPGNVLPTSASPVTALNWTRTSKDFDNAFVKYPVQADAPFEGPVPVADLRAKFSDGISLGMPDRDVEDLWALPEQWNANFPLRTQRHLGLLFSQVSDGLGRPVEIVTSWHRLVGRNAVLKITPCA